MTPSHAHPLTLLAAALLMAAGAARADIAVRFIEGAPKDRFEFVNRAPCALTATDITLDLAPAPAGLLFDTTAQGAGVEVFQPFELVDGASALSGHTRVTDGDRQVTLQVRRLEPGARIAFTVDVDDTLGPRGITVAGSEIAGALVRVRAAGGVRQAAFNAAGEAVVSGTVCR